MSRDVFRDAQEPEDFMIQVAGSYDAAIELLENNEARLRLNSSHLATDIDQAVKRAKNELSADIDRFADRLELMLHESGLDYLLDDPGSESASSQQPETRIVLTPELRFKKPEFGKNLINIKMTDWDAPEPKSPSTSLDVLSGFEISQTTKVRALATAAIFAVSGAVALSIFDGNNSGLMQESAEKAYTPQTNHRFVSKLIDAPSMTVADFARSTGVAKEEIPDVYPELKGLNENENIEGKTIHLWIDEAPEIRVKPGESLMSISRELGMPVEILAEANDLHNEAMLDEGNRLIIPRHGVEIVDLPEQEQALNTGALAEISGLEQEKLDQLNPRSNSATRLVLPKEFDSSKIELGVISALSPVVQPEEKTATLAPNPSPERAPASSESLTKLHQKVVHEARKYLGIKEDPTTPNHGPEIDKYFQMGLKGANAEWCASFVSRVLLDAGMPLNQGSTDGYKGPDWQVEWVNNLPNFVANMGGEVWHRSVITHPEFYAQPGDIVIYNRDGKLGDDRKGVNHTGLVVAYDQENDILTTIEGNVGNAVVEKQINLKAPMGAKQSRGGNVAGLVRMPQLHDSEQVIPVPEKGQINGEIQALSLDQLPADSIHKFNAYRPKIDNLEHVYKEVEAQTGVRWEYMAAIHYREGGNGPDRSMYAGEKLGSVNPDTHQVEPTDLIQNGIKAAKHFKGMASSVYGIDVTSDISPSELAYAFLAYNRGSRYKRADLSADVSPYPMNGYGAENVNMHFPNIGGKGSKGSYGEPQSVRGKRNRSLGAMVIVSGLGVFDQELKQTKQPEPAPIEQPVSTTTSTSTTSTSIAEQSTRTEYITSKIELADNEALKPHQVWVEPVNAMTAMEDYFADSQGRVNADALAAYVSSLPYRDGKVLVDILQINEELEIKGE